MRLIAFRVDASTEMGTGHVMRCLTLADALKAEGAQCHFVCREHPGHLLEQIALRGHQPHALPVSDAVHSTIDNVTEPELVHAAWLGCDWHTDAEQTAACLKNLNPDWLVLDHYALDARWESRLRSVCKKIMVIDDLADRTHDCDLLLDQTYGRNEKDYQPWVSEKCQLLMGSRYALLRPEFARLRDYSLKRRKEPRLEHLLITMGGVDKDNATGKVIEVLNGCPLPEDCRITIIMGATAPWLKAVQEQVETLRWAAEVKVNVQDMAQLMADSDLVIGAAGSTSWERCCLGLPTLMVVLADNQQNIGRLLEKKQAVFLVKNMSSIKQYLFDFLTNSTKKLKAMSNAASTVTDGHGVDDVIRCMELI